MKAKLAAALAAVAVITGCATAASPHAATVDPRPAPPPTHRYLGVSSPDGMAGVKRFAAETGSRPDLVSMYAGWYQPFDAKQTAQVSAYGALPLIFLDSGKVSLSHIAVGPDTWVTEYAKAIAAYGQPVVISFDSEFNGPWWPWSFQHESPKTFVAA